LASESGGAETLHGGDRARDGYQILGAMQRRFESQTRLFQTSGGSPTRLLRRRNHQLAMSDRSFDERLRGLRAGPSLLRWIRHQ